MFHSFKRRLYTLSSLVFVLSVPWAQDVNITHPVAEIEQKLKNDEFTIFRFRDLRFKGDIGKRVILQYPDRKDLQIKWRRALTGGHEFNNAPRFEIAAYELQKLFLDEADFVVPPTVVRGYSFEDYKSIEADADPTFNKPDMVIVMLQYWLNEVTVGGEVYNKKKFKSDPVYAKHFANTNIMTYIINHQDSNEGNLLTSTNSDNPRVFTVDNGVTFSSPKSNRGAKWKHIRVDRLPKNTVGKLKNLSSQILNQKMGVIAQFEYKDGKVFSVEPTENLNPKKGVRQSGNVVQFGLTKREIRDVEKKIKNILKQVKKGKYDLF